MSEGSDETLLQVCKPEFHQVERQPGAFILVVETPHRLRLSGTGDCTMIVRLLRRPDRKGGAAMHVRLLAMVGGFILVAGCVTNEDGVLDSQEGEKALLGDG